MNEIGFEWIIVALAVIAAVVAMSRGKKSESGDAEKAKPAAGRWRFESSPGMGQPAPYGAGGCTFEFPTRDGVHYLTRDAGPLASVITALVKIETKGAPTFNFHTNPNNTGTTPANFRLYIQRKGDNGYGEFHRWWRKEGVTLGPGNFALLGDLTRPGDWSSVQGKAGDSSPEATLAFHDAVRDVDKAGVTFGGGSFYGHGVFVDPGTGTAVFKIEMA